MAFVEVGKYKVAYMEKGNPNMLYSKMFNNIEDAMEYIEQFPKGSDVLLFQNIKMEFDEYVWQVVPNVGGYQSYRLGIFISDNKFLILGGLLLFIGILATSKN